MTARPRDGWLRTIHVALPTAFSEDGAQVREEPLSLLVKHLCAAGIETFLPAAANGEFHSLTVDEVVAGVRVTREALGSEGTVIAPVGFSFQRTLEIGRRALDAGADAILYMPPIHPYLCDAGFESFIREIGGALPAPLLLYKKGPVPSDEALVRLVLDGVVAGVKYAGADPDPVALFLDAIGGREGVICGTGERFAPAFALAGATGFSSGIANVAPRLSLRLLRELEDDAYDGAIKTLAKLRPLEAFRARETDSYNIAGLKGALRLAGRDFGPPRPPQRWLTAPEERELSDIVHRLLADEQHAADGRRKAG